ncbi:hypothetical protein CUR178_01083 [Leishmania enriettii]|uniref:Uncharacterized protein n=1 Tax=Leishmania enriettii TaxID=5663 RepID=A0A836GZ57_LEIEN|nr:hypothetical protein CUR178_01083 [Leishmania enriettii]
MSNKTSIIRDAADSLLVFAAEVVSVGLPVYWGLNDVFGGTNAPASRTINERSGGDREENG